MRVMIASMSLRRRDATRQSRAAEGTSRRIDSFGRFLLLATLDLFCRAPGLPITDFNHPIDQTIVRVSNANGSSLRDHAYCGGRDRRDNAFDLRHCSHEGVGHFPATEVTRSEEKRMRVRFEQGYDLQVVVLWMFVGRQNDPATSPDLRYPFRVFGVLLKVIGLQLDAFANRAQRFRDRLQAQTLVNEENRVTRLL